MSLKYLSAPTKILADSITSSATSFRLNNITGWNGQPLTSGDFGTQAYGVFRNAAKTQIELFEYDPATIANSTITIVRRGLKFDGDLTTEVAGNKKAWNKGDTQVDLGTDVPQLFQYLQEYIDGIAIAGAPDATTSAKGIGRVSVAPVAPATPIFVGDNDPRVPTQGENDAMAGGGAFGAPSSTNKFLTQEYAIFDFGDGSDGDVIIASPTTLTRDMYYNNLTVNSTLTTNGFRIFVKNTLNGTGSIVYPTGTNGTVGSTPDGGAGANGFSTNYGYLLNTPGSGGSAGGFQGTSIATNGGIAGTSPAGNANTGLGRTGANLGTGLAGTAGLNFSLGNANGTSGAGGVASGAGGGAAGAAGTDISISKLRISNATELVEVLQNNTVRIRRIAGAGGGAGGGAWTGTNVRGGGGGGGGASGGIIFIAARIWAGTFTLQAIGGNGGNGGSGTSSGGHLSGGGGGGAGGHGGYALVIFGQKTWTGSGTFTGGTGGTGGVGFGGGANGSAGANGTAGALIEIQALN